MAAAYPHGLPYQPPTIVISDATRLEEFKNLMLRHEISEYFAGKLRQLEGYQIVVIADDSGSMMNAVKPPPGANVDPYGERPTRWTELKATVWTIVEIAGLLDRDGCDIYFLNRPPVLNCTPWNLANLDAAFVQPPKGYTPMVRTLNRIMQDKQGALAEGKVLVLMATDGIPTDDRGNEDRRGLKEWVQRTRPASRMPLEILACTDEDDVVEFLNSLDENAVNCDVSDDYWSERQEVLKAQGPMFKFSRGDYIVKCLLGSIDPDLDKLDERPKGCCTIL